MAKKNDTVTVTEEFNCDKEIECAWCQTKFQYQHKMHVSGSGLNELQAKKEAARKALSDLEKEPGNEKCPTCGALQVSMEANSFAAGHIVAAVFAAIILLIAIGVGALLNGKLISFISLSTASYVFVLLLLIPVAYNLWLVFSNENSNLEAGLADAKQKVSDGTTKVLSRKPGIAVPESIPRSLTALQYVAIVLSVIGIALVPAAEIVRLASGWPSNSAAFPPVAGPGDEVTLYWPQSISCLKHFWKGTVTVGFADPDKPGNTAPLGATCETKSWGSFIGGKGATNKDTAIWTNVKLPDNPGLAGKTIRLPSRISVTYPHSTGLFGFEERQTEFNNEFQFRLASPKAASTFCLLWWGGLLAGGGLVVISGLLLRQVQLSLLKNSPQPETLNVRNAADADIKTRTPSMNTPSANTSSKKSQGPGKEKIDEFYDIEFPE